MTGYGYARTLAVFATDAWRDGVGDVRLSDQVGRVLDVVGNSIAAIHEDTVGIVTASTLAQAGSGSASAIGSGVQISPAHAALVNGTLAHALDFDDTHLPSILHPSAVIVPAALAVAEHQKSTGSELLTAVAIGNEVTCRIGMGAYNPEIRNSVFFEKGLHATSICGTIGAAVATALLLGADTDSVADSIGIAASMGSGLIEANRTGGTVKRLHCGWAAHSGVTAGLLAAAGMTGPPTVLEGRFGFFRAYTDGFLDEPAMLGQLGERWEIDRLFYKPYPANHFTHAAIDAAIAVRNMGVAPATITEIRLGAPAPVLRTIAEPIEKKASPETPYFAKFSGPYAVAAALSGGSGLGVGSTDFTDDAIHDSERLRLAGLVECYPDVHAGEIFPNQFPAVLTVTLDDGTQIENRVDVNRGGPENPLTTAELRQKFTINAVPVVGDELAHTVAASVENLSSAGSADALSAALGKVVVN